MTDRRFRIEVDRFHADGLHTSAALNVDPPELDSDTQALVDDRVDQLLAEARELGVHPAEAAWVAVGILVEDVADERAYRRVAERRGVLAL